GGAKETGRGNSPADQGGGDGLRGERARRVRRGGYCDLRRRSARNYLCAGRKSGQRPRGGDSRGAAEGMPVVSGSRGARGSETRREEGGYSAAGPAGGIGQRVGEGQRDGAAGG